MSVQCACSSHLCLEHAVENLSTPNRGFYYFFPPIFSHFHSFVHFSLFSLLHNSFWYDERGGRTARYVHSHALRSLAAHTMDGEMWLYEKCEVHPCVVCPFILAKDYATQRRHRFNVRRQVCTSFDELVQTQPVPVWFPHTNGPAKCTCNGKSAHNVHTQKAQLLWAQRLW